MNDRLQQQLQALNRLYKESEHIYSRLASMLGMTDTAFWVLYAITHSAELITQNDLCSDFFFPVQTIHSAQGWAIGTASHSRHKEPQGNFADREGEKLCREYDK